MEHKMTSGKISSTILKFAAPILIGQILQQLYNIIDSIIVGRYIGVEALAAVGATWSLSYIVCYFCIGTCMGILYSLAVIVIIFFAGDFLALLFVNADNMMVIGYTRKFLFYISFFHLELAVLFAFRYCVQGMGYGRFSIYSGTAEMLGRALVAIFLVPVFGFEAVCWNEGVTFLAGIAVIVPLYFWIERKFIE